MGGMAPGEQVLHAYTESKAEAPKAIADLNAVLAKAATMSATLAKYDLKLDVPAAVK